MEEKTRTDELIIFLERNREIINNLNKGKLEIDWAGKSVNKRITAFDLNINGNIFQGRKEIK